MTVLSVTAPASPAPSPRSADEQAGGRAEPGTDAAGVKAGGRAEPGTDVAGVKAGGRAEPGTDVAGVNAGGRAEPGTDVAGVKIVIEAFRVARVLGSADRSIGGPPRAWLLHRLAMTPDIRVADLADSCGLDASTTSRHVRTLEDGGLLTRSGDPDDRRAARLSLTPAGQAALDSALRIRGDLVIEATAHWSATDKQRLADLLTRLSGDLVLAGSPDPALVKGTSNA